MSCAKQQIKFNENLDNINKHIYIYIFIYIYILYIYIYIYQQNVCCSNFLMSVNGEIHNAYNLYIIKITVIIVPRGNFTKETNNF